MTPDQMQLLRASIEQGQPALSGGGGQGGGGGGGSILMQPEFQGQPAGMLPMQQGPPGIGSAPQLGPDGPMAQIMARLGRGAGGVAPRYAGG